jgi:hypothetical protein
MPQNLQSLVTICNRHFLARDFQIQTTSIADRKFSLPLCQQQQVVFFDKFFKH